MEENVSLCLYGSTICMFERIFSDEQIKRVEACYIARINQLKNLPWIILTGYLGNSLDTSI